VDISNIILFVYILHNKKTTKTKKADCHNYLPPLVVSEGVLFTRASVVLHLESAVGHPVAQMLATVASLIFLVVLLLVDVSTSDLLSRLRYAFAITKPASHHAAHFVIAFQANNHFFVLLIKQFFLAHVTLACNPTAILAFFQSVAVRGVFDRGT